VKKRLSPPFKNGEKWADGSMTEFRTSFQDTESECGVETANAVGMQSRPPLLIQRENNVWPPANAGIMQE